MIQEKINPSDDKLDLLTGQVEDFLNSTLDARLNSEMCRDYYDGNQWTQDQIEVLKRRHQAPIVVNRVKSKVQGLKGLLDLRRTDIKAYPRNPADEEKAHVATDGLRFVYEKNNFDTVKREVAEDKFIEGYGAVLIDAIPSEKEYSITINRVPWDRFYFDPYSRKKNFKDARYMGVVIWMDLDTAKDTFPDKKDELSSLGTQSYTDEGFDTFNDRPDNWLISDSNRRVRIRVTQHFFLEDGEWKVAYFTKNIMLQKPELTGYLDEEGKNICPLEADTAYVSRNIQRYGEVKGMLSQQDEINHRRSKALFLLSSRQIITKSGVLKDPNRTRNELKKADCIIEVNGDIAQFKIMDNNDMGTAQVSFYQDAKAEMDATSFNAQLAGERQEGDLSGVAIEKLQSAGALEINDLYEGLKDWEKRVFEQVWLRIKQFWTAEKWVRVTDDFDNLRWVGFNTQITYQKYFEETINNEELPLEERMGAQAALTTMAESQDPRLQAILEVRNAPAELDMDLIIEQSFDVVNTQNEQFRLLAQFAQNSKDLDVIELIELSNLKNKDELIEKIETRRQAMLQAGASAEQMKAQEMQVKNAKTFAETQKITQEAQQKAVETQLIMRDPARVTDVRL